MGWLESMTEITNPICKEHLNDSNMKQVKFDLLVEDIEKKLSGHGVGFMGAMIFLNRSRIPLLLIFDNQNANKYRRSILEKASIRLPEWFKYSENDLKDMKIKIKATKEFVGEYRKAENRAEAMKIIFWSLLAIAVDRTDYDEKITLIADLAHLLKFDEETLRDIIQIIKVVCGEKEEDFEFQTNEVREAFASVLSLFSR